MNLISFFCAASKCKSSLSYRVIDDVNRELNRSNREDTLFELLKVNCEGVKMAVIDCLNNVPLEQFSYSEMKFIVNLLTTYQGLSSGIMDTVLGKLMWITSKLVKDQAESVGKTFRNRLADQAIKEAIAILSKNSLRASIKDPAKWKPQMFLALSVVHFFKCASMTPDLAKKISQYQSQFCEFLKDDEFLLLNSNEYYPLELEKSGMGCNVYNIITAFTTARILEPYSTVCLRLLQTLGDVLSASVEYNPANVFADEMEESSVVIDQDPIDLIKKDLKRSERMREKKEEADWAGYPLSDKRIEEIKLRLEQLKNDVSTFSNSYMIDILVTYFSGNNPNCVIPNLSKYIDNFSKGKFSNMNLYEETKQQVFKIGTEFIESIEKAKKPEDQNEEKKK